MERKCRICGCTDEDCSQCIAVTGHPCHWVEVDLCSACSINEPVPQDFWEQDASKIDNAVLKRLVEEVRADHATGNPTAYNRLHNRHNRSRVQDPRP